MRIVYPFDDCSFSLTAWNSFPNSSPHCINSCRFSNQQGPSGPLSLKNELKRQLQHLFPVQTTHNLFPLAPCSEAQRPLSYSVSCSAPQTFKHSATAINIAVLNSCFNEISLTTLVAGGRRDISWMFKSPLFLSGLPVWTRINKPRGLEKRGIGQKTLLPVWAIQLLWIIEPIPHHLIRFL